MTKFVLEFGGAILVLSVSTDRLYVTYFRRNLISFAQMERCISWDFDTRFGQKCILNGTKFCENCQNSDLHRHN